MLDEKKLTNYIEQAKKREETDKKRQEISSKELLVLKESMNIVCRRKEGQIMARALMKMSGIYSTRKNNNNLYEIGKERGKEEMYLFLIKGLVDSEIVAEIERKIERQEG